MADNDIETRITIECEDCGKRHYAPLSAPWSANCTSCDGMLCEVGTVRFSKSNNKVVTDNDPPEWVKEPPTEPGWYRVILDDGDLRFRQVLDNGAYYGTNVDWYDHRPIEFLPVPEDVG